MKIPAPPVLAWTIVLWLIIAAVLWWWFTPAHAAEDNVCRPYATQFLNNQMKWLWDRAYNHCQLLEEDHPTPPAAGDWRGALDILEPNHTPLASIGTVPATDPKDPPAPSKVVPPKVVAPVITPAQVCGRVHKKVVFKGKSWKCV